MNGVATRRHIRSPERSPRHRRRRRPLDRDVLEVGKLLAGIPPEKRPARVVRGLAPDQLRLHKDHIHIGYMDEAGTRNTR